MRFSKTTQRASMIAAAGLALVAVGCASDSANITNLRVNPSPDLTTLSQSTNMLLNEDTVVRDENGRMFWADIRRALLLDRPSRLAPEPITY